jgi:threonine/homoserine/homoserine lactone efflux protein
MHVISVLFIGLLVSFLGQLPLGTMSLTSTQIAVEENFKNAWKYAIGVALAEMIYLRLVLSGVDWIVEHQLFYNLFSWLAVLLFFVLSVLSFVSAIRHKPNQKALLLRNNIDRFYLGLTMSAMNPAQIPFWFIWSTYVIELGGMNKSTFDYNLFTVGSGIGTMAGLILYMYGGVAIVKKMKDGTKKLNIIMCIIFLIAAFAQAYRIIFGNNIIK